MFNRRRAALLRVAFAALVSAFAAQAEAQSGDLYVYQTGLVRAITPLGDGRTLVAGDFGFVNGEPVDAQVVRLDAAGALEAGFRVSVGSVLQPNAAGDVRAVVSVPASGEAILAGAFARVQDEPVVGLAKVDASGALTPWRAVPAAGEPGIRFVDALLRVSADELIAVAALEDRQGAYILRVNATTGVYQTLFSVLGRVNTLLADPDGGVIVGGSFGTIAGTPAFNIARLLPGTLQLDNNFFYRSASAVTALARSPIDGLLHVGAGARVERVLPSGNADPKYFVAANGPIARLLFDDGGRLYLAGSFSIVNAAPRGRVARVSADGTLDPSWQPPEMRGDASRMELRGGRLLVGGTVLSAATDEAGLMTLSTGANPPGSPTPALRFGFALAESDRAYIVRATPDGGAIIAGAFSHTRDAVTGPLLRLNADGSLSLQWSPLISTDYSSLAVADDGTVYIAGQMALGSALSGVSQVVRVLPQGGAVDPAWRLLTPSDIPPSALTIDGDQLYLGGSRPWLNGVPQNLLARASRTGVAAIDPSWTPVCARDGCADGQIIVRADGSVITRPRSPPIGVIDIVPPPPPAPPVRILSLVTAMPSGTELVSPYGPLIDSQRPAVGRLQIDSQQRLYLTGAFRTAEAPVFESLLRTLPDGSIDPGFTPNLGVQRVAAGPAELVDDRYLYLITQAAPDGGTREVRRIDIASGSLDAGWVPVGPAVESATRLVRAGDRILVVGPAPTLAPQGGALRFAFLSQAATALFADSFE